MNLLKMFSRRDTRFPRKIKGHWYCGCWYLYLSSLRDKGEYSGTSLDPPDVISPAEGTAAFNPFLTGHARTDESGLIDGLIPVIRFGDTVGLYRQVGCRYRTTSNYDGAPWDDGYKIDLEFVRTIDIPAPKAIA